MDRADASGAGSLGGIEEVFAGGEERLAGGPCAVVDFLEQVDCLRINSASGSSPFSRATMARVRRFFL